MNSEEEIRLFGKSGEKKAAPADSAGKKKTEEAKSAEEAAAEKKELSEEDEKNVSGGTDPFPRVPDYDYDRGIRGKA